MGLLPDGNAPNAPAPARSQAWPARCRGRLVAQPTLRHLGRPLARLVRLDRPHRAPVLLAGAGAGRPARGLRRRPRDGLRGCRAHRHGLAAAARWRMGHGRAVVRGRGQNLRHGPANAVRLNAPLQRGRACGLVRPTSMLQSKVAPVAGAEDGRGRVSRARAGPDARRRGVMLRVYTFPLPRFVQLAGRGQTPTLPRTETRPLQSAKLLFGRPG